MADNQSSPRPCLQGGRLLPPDNCALFASPLNPFNLLSCMEYISPDIKIINKGKAEKDDFLLMAIKTGLREILFNLHFCDATVKG